MNYRMTPVPEKEGKLKEKGGEDGRKEGEEMGALL